MFKRHQNRVLRGSSSSRRKSKGRDVRLLSRRQFWVERLEERFMLTATPLEIGMSAPYDPARLQQVQAQAQAQAQAAMVNAVSFLPVAPFPLEQTFLLHSLPSATKVIYLDFDGFITRNTPWNTAYNQPNIVTPSYNSDDDQDTFSDSEKYEIQTIWEHVSE